MSGYTPVFGSVFQGSLCGKFPDLPLWLVLLALSNSRGEIDCHPSYIATISGIPEDQVAACIARFCEPDPSSRTPDEDGRRLLPIEGRGFGWLIVNHRKYREKARLAAKNAREVEAGKNQERLQYRRSGDATAADRRRPPQTDPSNSNTNTDKKGRERPARRCPEDFKPDEAFALREIPDLDVAREVQKFRDWEFKTPRKDWAACWRTWVGNCRDTGKYAKRTAPGKINASEWR